MFCPVERKLPTLQRGWRTPDPSPTPSLEGTEGVMGKVELCLVEKTPTAKENRGRSREPIRTIASRTPSPSPSRSSCSNSSASHESLLSAEATSANEELPDQTGSVSEDDPTPRCNFNITADLPSEPGQQAKGQDSQVVQPLWPGMQPRYGMLLSLQPVLMIPPPPEKAWRRDGTSFNANEDGTTTASTTDTIPSPVGNGDSSPLSIGSRGHPYLCAEACKYVKKARGCKDGANCNRCHVCSWSQSNMRRNKRRGGNSYQHGAKAR